MRYSEEEEEERKPARTARRDVSLRCQYRVLRYLTFVSFSFRQLTYFRLWSEYVPAADRTVSQYDSRK